MAGTKRRARKRGDGEGSIYRRADGIWIGKLMVGYRLDGKPDVRSVSSKTRAECQRKLDELRQRAAAGLVGDAAAGRETVGAFLQRWLQAIDGTVRESTHYRYRVNVEKHLVPTIGRYKLVDLRPEHLVALYAAKRKEGLAPRTVKYLHTTMRKALAVAVKWGAVRRNVAAVVDPPRVPRVEIAPPTPVQVAHLLESAETYGDRFAPLWTVAVYSGCREGELLGLKWEDVDLATGTINIRRTLVGARGGIPEFAEPKTARSRRTVRLPADAVGALKVQKDRQSWHRQKLGSNYADCGLVFASQVGTPLLPWNVVRAFKVALARAGLPRTIRVHDLRHAHATVMRKAGVDLKTVSERLGHSTIAITADLYTHAVDGPDAEAAERVQAAIRTARASSADSAGQRGQ